MTIDSQARRPEWQVKEIQKIYDKYRVFDSYSFFIQDKVMREIQELDLLWAIQEGVMKTIDRWEAEAKLEATSYAQDVGNEINCKRILALIELVRKKDQALARCLEYPIERVMRHSDQLRIKEVLALTEQLK